MTSPDSSPLTLALFAVSPGDQPRETTMTQIREVSAQELALYQSSLLDVSNVLEGFNVFVRKALNDLDTTVEEIRLVAGSAPIGSGVNTWRVDIEYRILNFCASVVAYYERVLAELARTYGGDSNAWASGRELFTDLFDKSLAYRIVYNLRNALIHGSSSLLKFSMNLKLPDETVDPSKARVSIGVPLSRDAFGSGSANSKVRAEIRELSEDPDVLVFCQQAYEELTELHLQVLPLLHPDLNVHTQYLRDIIFEASRNAGSPMMMTYVPDRFRETVKWIPLPNEVFGFVRSLYEDNPSQTAAEQ